MDRSIPAGAAILLRFIYETETGKEAPGCYEVIFGNRQSKLPKPLTEMTLEEVQRSQKYWSSRKWAARFGSSKASSAAGAPQLMRATLKGLIEELGLSLSQKLDADLQDRLAYHLLKRRGYEEFMAGEMSHQGFAKRLAMEWASFPVLAPTQGAHAYLQRGASYYAGDGLNKALVSPEKIEALLHRAYAAGNEVKGIETSDPLPIPSTKPTPKAGAKAGAIGLALVALGTAIAAKWGALIGWLGF